MAKKNILIIHPAMEIGGAERALLGLLDSIDYSSYDVDLLLCSHTGDFMTFINNHVNVLPYDKRFDFFQCPVSYLIRQGQFVKAGIRVWAKYLEKRRAKQRGVKHSVWHVQQIIHRATEPLLPRVKGHYDLAINFLGIPSILTHCVDAKVKMTWVHTDYSKIVADSALDKRMYGKVDWIINVSDDCKRIFDAFYPEFMGKSIVIENILNSTLVRKLAQEKEEIPFEKSKLNLLSIGRFGEAKNFETIPQICRIMIDKGLNYFKWYIIGYGAGEQLIRDNIQKYGVAEYVAILGKRSNPYPYIANCDVYLQPSRFEGKAVTVREAQILGKPVVVTAYDTAPSQITNGLDGVILPMETQTFAKALMTFLSDNEALSSLSKYCVSQDLGNENEAEKIYKLIQ